VGEGVILKTTRPRPAGGVTSDHRSLYCGHIIIAPKKPKTKTQNVALILIALASKTSY
jgi:hypothetical protein